MKLLALDTATEACSAALLVDGRLTERFDVQPRKHGDLILNMLSDLLREADLRLTDLDALAFGRGPGAFTGVRIATGVAQGAALGAGLPVVPISNLAALAHRAYREHGADKVLAALDARMGEVYWGAYAIEGPGLARLVGREQVAAAGALDVPPGAAWHGAGMGWDSYAEELSRVVGAALTGSSKDLLCSAWDIALLAQHAFQAGAVVAAEQALPVYLRDQVAWKKSRP